MFMKPGGEKNNCKRTVYNNNNYWKKINVLCVNTIIIIVKRVWVNYFDKKYWHFCKITFKIFSCSVMWSLPSFSEEYIYIQDAIFLYSIKSICLSWSMYFFYVIFMKTDIFISWVQFSLADYNNAMVSILVLQVIVNDFFIYRVCHECWFDSTNAYCKYLLFILILSVSMLSTFSHIHIGTHTQLCMCNVKVKEIFLISKYKYEI